VRLVRTGAIVSVMTLAAAPLVAGCNPPVDGDAQVDDEDVGESEEAVIGGGGTDWAQQQGQRNPTMVSFYKESWFNYTDCGARGGCQGVDLFIKLRVKPVAGANLANKHVGVVYRKPGTTTLTSVNGTYFSTWGNGDEEWHVKVSLRSWENIISFNAWYQDGVGNTFYDDNSSELHAIAIGGNHPAISHLWQYTGIGVNENGVLGNLDFDKELALVYTTDDWQTANWMNMGAGDNQLHWIEDTNSDFERWDVYVNLPGNFTHFKWAVVYKHGTANGATVYEFWDNTSGSNYQVSR
jgi:hypothetical protein